MKLALIGPTHPYRGGISHYNTRLSKALTDIGHDPFIINFKRLYPQILFPGKTQYDESATKFDMPSERIIDSINPLTWLKNSEIPQETKA